MRIVASFRLHLVCANCLEKREQYLGITEGDDAPMDIDDLMESGVLAATPFQCKACEGIIGELVGITQMPCNAAA
ncbi:hypothetical protein GCM10011390_42000 [Aureimonas endophytica]|uniref:Uncharacterized protein n=1 Tax=Aureimonas endophytica TaxID=2027858 RepID=A0A917EBD6_9HYPH|nr:hypothetical protein GCM10011390_42000 [Aureimonas endophytica]